MNQREWYDHINAVRRKHFAEIEQLRRRHEDEIRRLERLAAKAEPADDFSFSIMTAADCGKVMALGDEYSLAA